MKLLIQFYKRKNNIFWGGYILKINKNTKVNWKEPLCITINKKEIALHIKVKARSSGGTGGCLYSPSR